MKITRPIWLYEYVTKMEVKHRVYRDEVRQVLLSKPHVRRIGKGKRRRSEDLCAAYGQTKAGRYLTICFNSQTWG